MAAEYFHEKRIHQFSALWERLVEELQIASSMHLSEKQSSLVGARVLRRNWLLKRFWAMAPVWPGLVGSLSYRPCVGEVC